MTGVTGSEGTFDVVCPHCKKPFIGELMAGSASRYEGFKCPHCRLFFPFERLGEAAPADPAA
jgi:DNA-directed RNA polymerase subunit RPC12/RpoP